MANIVRESYGPMPMKKCSGKKCMMAKKGMHKMPNGKMMKNSEMKGMMGK